jgi:alpha-beta hydrolase superfamily lysophospholipase
MGDREMRGCKVADFALPGHGRSPIRKLTGFQPDVDAIKSNYRPLLLSLSPGQTRTRELQ